MPSFTFHVREGARRDDPAALDDAVLVKDGFSPAAFVFTVLWALWHRMWLVAFGLFLAKGALVVVGTTTSAHPLAVGFADLLLNLVIGLEASTLRAWHLGRTGRPAALVTIADSRADAEEKAPAQWAALAPARLPPSPIPGRPGSAVPAAGQVFQPRGPVLGLFPDAETRR